MDTREKIIVLITAGLVIGVGFHQGKTMSYRREQLRRKLENIGSLRDKLIMVSGAKKRRDELKRKFVLRKAKSLQQVGYSLAKDCSMKIVMAVPRKQSVTLGLVNETVSLTVEATYDQLMCYVKRLEKISEGVIYVGSIAVNKRINGSEGKKSKVIYQMEIILHRLSLPKEGTE